jgi:hypothetical protein
MPDHDQADNFSPEEQSLWKLLHDEQYDISRRLTWFCDGPEHGFIKGRVLARYLEEVTTATSPDHQSHAECCQNAINTARNELLVEILGELPEKMKHYQQETERTKREKAYFNKAIDTVVAVIKQRMGSSQNNTTPTVLGHEVALALWGIGRIV